MIDQLKTRELLKKTENKFISDQKALRIFNVDKTAALEILSQLGDMGYIEKTGIEGLWQCSLRGKVLVNKKFSKEFRVDTLKKQLANLLKRLKIVNASKEYPYCVSDAIITSEYPIELRSNGINIAYSLQSKGFTEKEYWKAAQELRKRHKGNFGNIVEYHAYPHEAIRLFLKSRSPILKLRNYSNNEIQEITGYKILIK